MTAEESKQQVRERVKAEMAASQAEYDKFRYTDAQHEQVLEFIGAAMKALRGEATFNSLTRLLPVARVSAQSINGEAYRGGIRYSFDANFLNKWTSIYVLGSEDAGSGKVEPYHLQVEFRPSMVLQRERLESLLQLKVVPGWTEDGGNLSPELPQLHGLRPFNGGNFYYSPVNEPSGDFRIEVHFTYLNGPDRNPYRANVMTRMSITRRYLIPQTNSRSR